MLILKLNQANQIGVTVKELKTLPSPNYLFEFYSQIQDKSFFVYLPIQNDSERFDLFTVTLPTDINLPTGSFLYRVYQSEDTNPDPTGKLLLEQGRAEVVKEFPTDSYYTFNTENEVNYVD
jgi:hypothetical protein